MAIKKVMQLGLLSSAVILLVGCGGARNYATAVNSWQGAPESALVRDWGHPTHVSHLSNGNTAYMYRVVVHEPVTKTYAPAPGFVRLSPQNNNTVALSHPSISPTHRGESFWCETTFEVNKRGVIVDTHYKGNNCVTSEAGAHRWSFVH